jgi:hypothetical protein
MGNRLFGMSDLADTLPHLYFGMDPFDRSRIFDTDIELNSGLQLLQVVHDLRASPLLCADELAQYFP